MLPHPVYIKVIINIYISNGAKKTNRFVTWVPNQEFCRCILNFVHRKVDFLSQRIAFNICHSNNQMFHSPSVFHIKSCK